MYKHLYNEYWYKICISTTLYPNPPICIILACQKVFEEALKRTFASATADIYFFIYWFFGISHWIKWQWHWTSGYRCKSGQVPKCTSHCQLIHYPSFINETSSQRRLNFPLVRKPSLVVVCWWNTSVCLPVAVVLPFCIRGGLLFIIYIYIIYTLDIY